MNQFTVLKFVSLLCWLVAYCIIVCLRWIEMKGFLHRLMKLFNVNGLLRMKRMIEGRRLLQMHQMLHCVAEGIKNIIVNYSILHRQKVIQYAYLSISHIPLFYILIIIVTVVFRLTKFTLTSKGSDIVYQLEITRTIG